jgi:tetratricopeptide (TPR) repeat protein
MYAFIIVPLIPIVYLIIRKIYASTIQKPQKRSRVEELRIAALSHEESGEYVSAAVIYENDFNDFEKAAELYELGADYNKAARLFESLGQNKKAKELYEKAGELEPAAGLARELGLLEEAAKLYQASGNHIEAAQALEKAGRKLAAAKSYREAGKYRQASELLHEIGMHKEAAEMFSIVLRDKKFSFETMDDYFLYASLLEKAGEEESSQDMFRQIAALDPDFRDVGERIKIPLMENEGDVGSRHGGIAPPVLEPEKAAESASGPVPENSLRSLLREKGRMEPKDAVKIWVQCLKGLKSYQQEVGAHGRLSPECILIENGTALIKQSSARSAYAEEGAVDASSDIYSMGLILNEMLSGELSGPDIFLKPEFPSWLFEMMQKCTRPRGEGRFANIDEIFAALKYASQRK